MSNYATDTDADHNGRHPVNILHLVMGVIFLGVVTIWALVAGQVASTEDLRWLVPLPWVVAGGAGLLVITLSRRRQTTPTGATTEP